MTDSDFSMKDTLVQCLSQQINEYELLKSMYPNRDEIILTDKNIIGDIQHFLENPSDTEYTPNHLDFILNLNVNGLKLETCVNLPSLYPNEDPDIYIRCNQFNRQQETFLNNELSTFIKSNHVDDVSLHTVISWLQDNIETFSKKTVHESDDFKHPVTQDCEEKFCRFWIYSHHIYNKRKREDIVKFAKELNLTGCCLPGKPGIICIEGTNKDCKEWWRDIKSMSWKKIMIRKTETFELDDRKANQKFDKFEEVHFPNLCNNKHADISGFSKLMEQHGLTAHFNEFLGICNQQR